MKEYILDINREDPNLNGAKLELWDENGETTLVKSFTQLTDGGYASKKPFYEDLDIIKWEDPNWGAIITEECANRLIEKYANVNAKTFVKPKKDYTYKDNWSLFQRVLRGKI